MGPQSVPLLTAQPSPNTAAHTQMHVTMTALQP
jgi:hypothetical protein